MLKVQKNSRQMPSVKKYTADKKYCDLLYGVLQEQSYVDEDKNRYIDKENINFTRIGKRVGLTRQTIAKKFQHLIELGLIKEQEGRFKMNFLDAKVSALIPVETLRLLNNSLSCNCINVYIYLLKRFMGNQEKEFMVTMNQIKSFIGLSINTTSNNEVVNDILIILKKMGLVQWQIKIEREEKHYYINFVTNKIT